MHMQQWVLDEVSQGRVLWLCPKLPRCYHKTTRASGRLLKLKVKRKCERELREDTTQALQLQKNKRVTKVESQSQGWF